MRSIRILYTYLTSNILSSVTLRIEWCVSTRCVSTLLRYRNVKTNVIDQEKQFRTRWTCNAPFIDQTIYTIHLFTAFRVIRTYTYINVIKFQTSKVDWNFSLARCLFKNNDGITTKLTSGFNSRTQTLISEHYVAIYDRNSRESTAPAELYHYAQKTRKFEISYIFLSPLRGKISAFSSSDRKNSVYVTCNSSSKVVFYIRWILYIFLLWLLEFLCRIDIFRGVVPLSRCLLS